MAQTTYIEEMMGFDPAEVVTAFESSNSDNSKKYVNPNIYKTNPANSVSEDGCYHAKVRVLLNPYDIKHSIVHQARYSMRDENGFFAVNSLLSVGNKECPIFKAWKKLWFSRISDPADPSKMIFDPEKQAWAKTKFQKTESDWVLVQIIEDENQPELVGQFKVMKIAKVILTRLLAKMNPADPKKQKQPLMDYLFGPVLELNVKPGPDVPGQPERKQREISYELSDFETDPTPIIKTDGTPLFSDEELQVIEDYNDANKDLLRAKTEANRQKAISRKQELVPSVKELYGKAIDYMKTNGVNPEIECGYTPWNEETTARVNAWIEKVLQMEDPASSASAVHTAHTASTDLFDTPKEQEIGNSPVPYGQGFDEDSDLPF